MDQDLGHEVQTTAQLGCQFVKEEENCLICYLGLIFDDKLLREIMTPSFVNNIKRRFKVTVVGHENEKPILVKKRIAETFKLCWKCSEKVMNTQIDKVV